VETKKAVGSLKGRGIYAFPLPGGLVTSQFKDETRKGLPRKPPVTAINSLGKKKKKSSPQRQPNSSPLLPSSNPSKASTQRWWYSDVIRGKKNKNKRTLH
jgi:hypothetical protein